GREWAECGGGALELDVYQRMLADAGLVDGTIELTHETGPGLHGAAVRARKPPTLPADDPGADQSA
ncbi:MAG: arsenite S-adenosylmethyltransferase, partial [Actinomycetota bacterium]